MDDGLLYLKRKRLLMMAISTAQVILGSTCIMLWFGAIEYCNSIANNPSYECAWTNVLQGLWGGAFVFTCGVIGMIQACKPSIGANNKHLMVCIAAFTSALGMVAVELCFMYNYIDMNQKIYEKILIWKYFHWTLVSVGILCALLSFVSGTMSCYAQCGCCGTYCDNEEDLRAYERLNSSVEPPVVPTYQEQSSRQEIICDDHCLSENNEVDNSFTTPTVFDLITFDTQETDQNFETEGVGEHLSTQIDNPPSYFVATYEERRRTY